MTESLLLRVVPNLGFATCQAGLGTRPSHRAPVRLKDDTVARAINKYGREGINSTQLNLLDLPLSQTSAGKRLSRRATVHVRFGEFGRGI